MTKQKFTIVFFLLFCACTNNSKNPEDIAGGPCMFDTTVTPIVVSNINRINPNIVALTFVQHYIDSFQYNLNVQDYEKRYNAKAADLKVTDTFQLLELHTIKGSCDAHPQIFMKRYKGK